MYKNYKIAIGCDPNAKELKKEIIKYLETLNYDIKDFGNDDPIYANTAFSVAEAVSNHSFDRGLLFCGTGIGVCLAANKVLGARAVNCTDSYSVERSIKSNNANILTLGSQVVGIELAKTIITKWLSYEYQPGGRSDEKIDRIKQFEEKHIKKNE